MARADEQLGTLRRAFLPVFLLVHIPANVNASSLREVKPFLWFVIMALTMKSVSEQFAMENTIWYVISRRVIREHLADLDLFLGIICFTSWLVSPILRLTCFANSGPGLIISRKINHS